MGQFPLLAWPHLFWGQVGSSPTNKLLISFLFGEGGSPESILTANERDRERPGSLPNGSSPTFPPVCCWARTHTGIRRTQHTQRRARGRDWPHGVCERDAARAPGGAAAKAAIKALRREKVADPSAERTIVFSGAHTAARCALPYVTVADFHWISIFTQPAHRKILTHSQRKSA